MSAFLGGELIIDWIKKMAIADGAEKNAELSASMKDWNNPEVFADEIMKARAREKATAEAVTHEERKKWALEYLAKIGWTDPHTAIPEARLIVEYLEQSK